MQDRERFITENHKLIYQFAHDHHLVLNDYYDVLAIGLIKAVDTFNKEKGFTFSTYAFSVMKNEYLMELRKRRRDRLTYALSLENIAVDDIPFIELVKGDEDIPFKFRDDLIKALYSLDNTEKFIINCMMDGLTQDDIAIKLNCSQAQISRKLTKIKQKYNETKDGGTAKWKK